MEGGKKTTNTGSGKNKKKGRTNIREQDGKQTSGGAAPPGFDAQASKSSNDQQQRLFRHRSLFVFRSLVGKAVEVHLVDSSRYVGILDCIDPDDFSVVLKNTQRKSESKEPFQSGSTMIFKRRQLVQIFAEGVLNYTESSFSTVASTNGFRTDTEISGKQNEQLFGRELQHASSWLDPGLDIGELEDNRNRSSKSWNQFEANEKLFGVTSSYDENLYTTKLDKTKLSTEQSAKAERLAREIEKQATTNFHLQEERGQVIHDDEDIDEEARYSSVDRQFGRSSSAYVPPALRNTQKQGVTKSTPSSSSYGDAVASKPVSFSDAVKGKPSPPVPTKQTPPGTKSESKPQSPEKQSETSSTPKAQSPSKKTTSLTKSKLSPTKTSSPLKKKPQSPTKTPETKPEDSKPPAPAKKGLNPNAKEFKLSAGAASFTPEKFTAGGHPGGGYPRQPHPQHYSHGHHIPVPPMYGVPEEWIYENGAAVEEGEYPPNAYAPYGAPMGPNGSMMQPMYPPVMPQQRGGRGYGGYHHGAYNPRGYYPAMPYPGVMGPQPPLPREPNPDVSVPPAPPVPVAPGSSVLNHSQQSQLQDEAIK